MGHSVVRSLVETLEALHRDGKIDEQLAEVRAALRDHPQHPDVKSVAAAILIDGGFRTGTRTPISEGIALVEELLSEPIVEDPDTFRDLQYNLVNGYVWRAQMQDCEAERKSDEARARSLFQGFSLDADFLRPDLHGKVLTNYGNFLDSRARVFEAVDAYAEVERIQPNHPMALFNCAKALRYALPLSGRHQFRNLYEAWDRLDRACHYPEEMVDLSGQVALDDARAELRETEALIAAQVEGGLKDLQRRGAVHRLDHGTPCHQLMRDARNDRALVTFNQFPGLCGCEIQDDAFFDRLFVRPDDKERLNRLASTLNSVKEDIATSRYLYYCHTYHAEEIREVSGATLYADTTGLAEYGVAAGLLKASLRVAIDSLDKIGVFLNQYFALGHPQRRVNFRNVWYPETSRTDEVHPTLIDKMEQNWLLRALHDLSCDWRTDDFPQRLREARDAATHRGLTLYYIGLSADDDIESWTTEGFARAVMMTIRTAKAAALYLISAIQVAELQHESDSNGVIVPMTFRLGRGLADEIVDDLDCQNRYE